MRLGELADAIDGVLCFGEGFAEVLGDVEHLGPDLFRDVDVGGARFLDGARRIGS